jgi:hypothetical protein
MVHLQDAIETVLIDNDDHRCKGTTIKGTRCKLLTDDDNDFCSRSNVLHNETINNKTATAIKPLITNAFKMFEEENNLDGIISIIDLLITHISRHEKLQKDLSKINIMAKLDIKNKKYKR